MRNETFTVAAELGQPQVVSDMEFFMFVAGESHRLGLFRRFRVWLTLGKEPWSTKLAGERRASKASTTDQTRLTELFDEGWEEVAGEGARKLDTPGECETSLVDISDLGRLRPIPGLGGGYAAPPLDQLINHCRRLSLALSVGRSSSATLNIDRSSIKVVDSLKPTLKWAVGGSSIERIALLERMTGMELQCIDRPSGNSWTIEANLKSSTLYCWHFWLKQGGKTEQVEYAFTTPSLEALEFAAGRGQPNNDLEHGVLLVELSRHSEALPLLEASVLELSGEELEAAQNLIAAVRLQLLGD